jgi:uncharacterized protein (DUF427 family)
MPRAIWNGAVIAEASDDDVEIVENNVYFPLSKVNQDYLQPSETETACPWKGTANYYHVAASGDVNRDAAWTYRKPLDAARQIANHVAFWHGVEVQP